MANRHDNKEGEVENSLIRRLLRNILRRLAEQEEEGSAGKRTIMRGRRAGGVREQQELTTTW